MHATAATFGVSVDELRDLFTGVPAEDDGWSTTPTYSMKLALEIARRNDCDTEWKLRAILFDDTNVDEIPRKALEAIELAVKRYRAIRVMQGPRGL